MKTNDSGMKPVFKIGDVFIDKSAMIISVIDSIIHYDEDDSYEYIISSLYIDKSNPQRIEVKPFEYVMIPDELYRDARLLNI